MARQPIYDSRMRLWAYELLYRRGFTSGAGNISSEDSAQAVITSLVDVGLKRLAEGRRAFVNVDEELLMSEAITLFPRNGTVLEILETVNPNKDVIAAIKRLRAQNYIIALDDFIYSAAWQPIVQMSQIIKLDVASLSELQLNNHVQQLKRPGLMLLAEKVEDQAKYRQCRRLGFDLFQGYFFAKPEVVEGRALDGNRLQLMRILAELQNPEVAIRTLERVIATDMSLSVRILQIVNSAQLSLGERVSSLAQAISLLGLQTVSSLASLLMMSSCADKPSELTAMALTRAKMCESIAQQKKLASPESFFTTGLLSLLDAFFDLPMSEVAKGLPLTAEVHESLVNENAQTPQSDILRIAKAFERGLWDQVTDRGVTLEEAAAAQENALTYMRESKLMAA